MLLLILKFKINKELGMPREIDIFVDFLKKKNLKLTNQREEIINIFFKTNRHLSVEDLYDIVKKKAPHIGQATVFRTLKLLCEAGLAGEVDFGDKKIRYEHEFGHQHHDHLVCVKCNKFIEVIEPKIEKLQDALCKKFSFSPQRHRLEIFGICRECRLRYKKRRND
jgi:Fur family ferric uptake transcriptional regulator